MSSRTVYAIAAILGLTAAFACWCRAPLIWDGAYQFDMTLALQRPYVYLTRFHTFFLWWPTVWASRFTDNVVVLQTLFGLPFLLAPMAGLLLSWWMVKDRSPHLIIWAVFGIAAATLPGQIFVINDSIFQQHLFWPVFLGMLVPMDKSDRPRRFVRAALLVFQLAHPLGVPLLFGGAAAVALVAVAYRTHRRQLLSNVVMLCVIGALAVAKIFLSNHIEQFRDTYAAHEMSWEVLSNEWRRGVLGAPIIGLCWIWASGILVFAQARRTRDDLPRTILTIAAICSAAVGCLFWLHWANDATGESWMGAIDYRRWIGPFTAPFFVLATIEAFIAAGKDPRAASSARPLEQGVDAATGRHDVICRAGVFAHHRCPHNEAMVGEYAHPTFNFGCATLRGRIGILLAATFALVLGLQSATWARLTDQLMARVNGYDVSVIVPYSAQEVSWFRHTPLGHWATGNYVSTMQGKVPTRIFLDPVCERELRANPPQLVYYADSPDSPPGPGGWFDFRPLLKRVTSEPSTDWQRRAKFRARQTPVDYLHGRTYTCPRG